MKLIAPLSLFSSCWRPKNDGSSSSTSNSQGAAGRLPPDERFAGLSTLRLSGDVPSSSTSNPSGASRRPLLRDGVKADHSSMLGGSGTLAHTLASAPPGTRRGGIGTILEAHNARVFAELAAQQSNKGGAHRAASPVSVRSLNAPLPRIDSVLGWGMAPTVASRHTGVPWAQESTAESTGNADHSADIRYETSGGSKLSVQDIAALPEDRRCLDLSSSVGTFSLSSDLEPLKGVPLKELKLKGCRLADRHLLALKGMSIEQLNISGNPELSHQGLALGLEGMQIKSLDLRDCHGIDVGLLCLPDMPLQILKIGSPSITDDGLKNLANFPDLKDLRLSKISITGPGSEHLKSLNLQSLLLDSCRFMSGASLGGSSLTKLTLTDCRGIGSSSSMPESFQGNNLTRLSLNRCGPISNEDFKKLDGIPLKELHLNMKHSPGFSDKGLEYIGALPLEKLELLSCNNITSAGIEYLRQCSSLKSLMITHNQKVNDQALVHLRDLPLEILDLSRTSITDAGLANLQHCPLKSLDISYNKGITGTGLTHLNGPFLEDLNISGTNITANKVRSFNAPALKALNLTNCPKLLGVDFSDLKRRDGLNVLTSRPRTKYDELQDRIFDEKHGYAFKQSLFGKLRSLFR